MCAHVCIVGDRERGEEVGTERERERKKIERGRNSSPIPIRI